MPYIAIKAFPKDDETKKAMTEKINQALIDVLNCPPEVISISFEEIQPADWEEKVIKADIEPKMDKMMILSGKRTDKMA